VTGGTRRDGPRQRADRSNRLGHGAVGHRPGFGEGRYHRRVVVAEPTSLRADGDLRPGTERLSADLDGDLRVGLEVGQPAGCIAPP